MALKFVLNRTLGDGHWLVGLEKKLRPYSIIDTADPYYYYSYQAAKYIQQNSPQTRLLCTYCETLPHNNEGTTQKKRIKQFVLEKADLFVCHTALSRQALIKEGVTQKRIRVVPLGVDPHKFHPNPKAPERLLFVGRLVPEKGIWLLWEAYLKLLKEFPKLELIIVGEGPLKQELTAKIAKCKLTTQVSLKATTYQKIDQVYRQASIFIMPSYSTTTWSEQYGVVLLEAMASGLAIVAANSGAIPLLLGNAGILIPEKNITAISQAIRKLLLNHKQQLLLRQKARQRVLKAFTIKQFTDKINSIYAELSGSHSHT